MGLSMELKPTLSTVWEGRRRVPFSFCFCSKKTGQLLAVPYLLQDTHYIIFRNHPLPVQTASRAPVWADRLLTECALLFPSVPDGTGRSRVQDLP